MTDEYLCVKGSDGTIFALGDAATVEQAKALSRAKVSLSLPFQIPSAHGISEFTLPVYG